MDKKYIHRSLVIVFLFFLGMWIFNHFPYPFVGIMVAVGCPSYLAYQAATSSKSEKDKNHD